MFRATFIFILFLITPISKAAKFTKFAANPVTGNEYEQDSNYIADHVNLYPNEMIYEKPRLLLHNTNRIPNVPLPLYFLNQSKKNNRRMDTKKTKESSIFYIRLPPTPYMMVPGLGYISQPPNITPLLAPAPSQLAQPISFQESFISDNAYDNYMESKKEKKPAQLIKKKNFLKNSKIERIRGLFYFNGRPEKVLILPTNESI